MSNTIENNNSKITIIIEGNDGTGKSSFIKKSKFNNKVVFKDRGILTKITLQHNEDWPKKQDLYDSSKGENEKNTFFIILDANFKESEKRIKNRKDKKIDKWETTEMLFLYQKIYIQLGFHYGTWYYDTTNKTLDEVVSDLDNIIEKMILKSSQSSSQEKEKLLLSHKLPEINSNDFDTKFEKSLKTLDEGHSKLVKQFNSKFDIIKLKPTVFSHTHQRAGIIPGTDLSRLQSTRELLDILTREMIPHCYKYIGNKYIVTEHLDPFEIPPTEIIVKRYFIGSDKYRYYHLKDVLGKDKKPIIVEEIFDKTKNEMLNKYVGEPVVRIDYRNPNHVTMDWPKSEKSEKTKPLGDILLCDDLAEKIIDVENTKNLASKTFKVLEKHFFQMDLKLIDICFMTLRDGLSFYGEISPDCMRLRKKDVDGLSDVSKDTWRAGGSSSLVNEKWKTASDLITKYVKKKFYSN